MADHTFPGEHMYQNVLLQVLQKAESVDEVKEMSVVDGDILIATYPKAGTTWMEELTYIILNDGDREKALQTPLANRMLYLEHSSDHYYAGVAGVDLLKSAKRPAIMKTHLPAWAFQKQLNEGRLKIILVIRNPKDTLVSMYHFYRMNTGLGNFKGSWDDFFELYKTKHILYGDFFDWYRSWIPYLDKPNVQLYAYEDMKNEIHDVINRLCIFLNKTLPEEKINTLINHTSFEGMKANQMVNYADSSAFRSDISPFMRKGEVGDWRNYFSPEQNRLVEKEYKTKLESQGIKLQFE